MELMCGRIRWLKPLDTMLWLAMDFRSRNFIICFKLRLKKMGGWLLSPIWFTLQPQVYPDAESAEGRAPTVLCWSNS